MQHWMHSLTARAVADWESCRVVGGHMVTIHVARVGADVGHRPTADADLAAPVAVLGEPEFAERLKGLGYSMVDGSPDCGDPPSMARHSST